MVTTLSAAFAAGQQALGLLHFEKALTTTTVDKLADDPAACLPQGYVQTPLMDHVRRQIR